MLPRDDGGLVRKPLLVKEDSVKTRFVFAPTASGSDPASFPSATGRPRSTPTRAPSASRSWGGRRGRSPWDKRRSKSAKTVKRPRAQLSRSQSVTYLFIPSLTRLQTRHMTDPHALPPPPPPLPRDRIARRSHIHNRRQRLLLRAIIAVNERKNCAIVGKFIVARRRSTRQRQWHRNCGCEPSVCEY